VIAQPHDKPIGFLDRITIALIERLLDVTDGGIQIGLRVRQDSGE